jgi:multidrug resistance efflux pump
VNRKKVIVGALLLAAITVGCSYYWPFGTERDTLRLSGIVEMREVRLGSKVGGRVASVLTREADVIHAGQLLVTLEAPELKAQIEQARAKLAAARAAKAKADNGPREQEKVAAEAAYLAARARLTKLEHGDREEDRRAAAADVEVARTELTLAEEEYRRTEHAYRHSAASRSEYDTAIASLDRAKAKLASARTRLTRAEKGRPEDLTEARNEAKRLEAEWELLREGTRYEEREQAQATVNELAGRLKELEANLAETEIRAPGTPEADPDWSATVEMLLVRRGDLVAPNTAAVRVLRTDDLWVKVYVPETELGKLRLGQEVEVTVDAYPDRRFEGKVIQIAGDSEFTPRNIQSLDERKHQVFGVKVKVEDREGIFKSGMAAEVIIPLGKR